MKNPNEEHDMSKEQGLKHVMVDIESLGVNPGALIISIGAVRFDPHAGIVPLVSSTRGYETFYAVLDLNQAGCPGIIDPKTVKWWFEQDEDARRDFIDDSPKVSGYNLISSFEGWLERMPVDHFWSNGPTFDEMLLRAAFTGFGAHFPVHYRASRCMRTMMALWRSLSASDCVPCDGMPDGVYTPHNALHDAHRQARIVTAVTQAIRRGEILGKSLDAGPHGC